jgi:hypothetical protein
VKCKIRTVPSLQKQLQTALILSVTFIWSYPWVGLNGLWLNFFLNYEPLETCFQLSAQGFCEFSRLLFAFWNSNNSNTAWKIKATV